MRSFSFIAILAFTALARAEPAPEAQRLSFEDDRVEGDIARPDDARLDPRLRARFVGLVRARVHFLPELVASADAR